MAVYPYSVVVGRAVHSMNSLISARSALCFPAGVTLLTHLHQEREQVLSQGRRQDWGGTSSSDFLGPSFFSSVRIPNLHGYLLPLIWGLSEVMELTSWHRLS